VVESFGSSPGHRSGSVSPRVSVFEP
jgi:hypothetical protein